MWSCTVRSVARSVRDTVTTFGRAEEEFRYAEWTPRPHGTRSRMRRRHRRSSKHGQSGGRIPLRGVDSTTRNQSNSRHRRSSRHRQSSVLAGTERFPWFLRGRFPWFLRGGIVCCLCPCIVLCVRHVSQVPSHMFRHFGPLFFVRARACELACEVVVCNFPQSSASPPRGCYARV